MRWCRLSVFGLPLLAACGGFGGGVARVVDGQVHEGRFIHPDSYAAYARGSQLEALEQYPAAEKAYAAALDLDPDSVGIWTRLGSVRCASGQRTADDAFEQAEQIEPDFAALWYERGRCQLRRREARQANTAALRALALDPLHLPTTTLVVETFLALEQSKSALRYLEAAIALHPNLATLAHWKRAILRNGSGRPQGSASSGSPSGSAPNGGAPNGGASDGGASDGGAPDGGAPNGNAPNDSRSNSGAPRASVFEAGAPPALDALDQALLNDSPDEAQELALALDLPESELAARAVALGKVRPGWERAKLVQEADPADGTAWVTLLSASDLLRNEALYEAALSALDAEPTAPSPLGVLLFAELLKRRVGEDAARAWLDRAATTTPDNPLVARQLRRLLGELGGARPVELPPQTRPQSP